MTDEELDAVRAAHVRAEWRAQGEVLDVFCAAHLCNQDWPCDAAKLLAEVDRLRVDVEMARQQRDAWQRLARQGVTWTGASNG